MHTTIGTSLKDRVMEGKALHRSNYGVKTYTPEEIKNQWKEVVEVKLLNRLGLS